MRMILMLGIMIASLPTFTSLSVTAQSESYRSQIFKAILRDRRESRKTSKRSETVVGVPYRIDCCPSETHLIHPRGGIARDGRLLELYRDHRTVQKFYQTSCKQETLNQPCRFIKRSYHDASRCVQRYSYVYAMVRDFNVSESFRLDYIRVKSGCSCELEVTVLEE
ncbi:uncharacterized protein LOC131935975 [Physella acuta]|uniref:uncharacterized protein LOC131935975 n=1 Tax=Physella acuta TaxID=109671 RepID=UPI0027DD8C69|nr:uncharacterized protein LOC131935975 [Physella acuta]